MVIRDKTITSELIDEHNDVYLVHSRLSNVITIKVVNIVDTTYVKQIGIEVVVYQLSENEVEISVMIKLQLSNVIVLNNVTESVKLAVNEHSAIVKLVIMKQKHVIYLHSKLHYVEIEQRSVNDSNIVANLDKVVITVQHNDDIVDDVNISVIHLVNVTKSVVIYVVTFVERTVLSAITLMVVDVNTVLVVNEQN